MNLNPMEQFAIKPLVAEPLFSISGHPIYFTNQALLMLIVAGASALFLSLAVKPGRQASKIKNEVYELFPVLKEMLHRRGGDLSGGQQQQLAIARALLADPKLIILDEPTEGIQPSIIKDIGRVIRLLRERGDIAILLCEQYFDYAHELADKFVVLSRGEVVASGTQDRMNNEDVKRHLAV